MSDMHVTPESIREAWAWWRLRRATRKLRQAFGLMGTSAYWTSVYARRFTERVLDA